MKSNGFPYLQFVYTMKPLEPDRFDRKEKQTFKKKKTFILASDLYRIYSSDPPIISKKTSVNLTKLFHVTDISDQIIQKHAVNLGSK